jgi:hypothetical protein
MPGDDVCSGVGQGLWIAVTGTRMSRVSQMLELDLFER